MEVLAREDLTIFHVLGANELLLVGVEAARAQAAHEHAMAHEADLVTLICQQRWVGFAEIPDERLDLLGAHVSRLVVLNANGELLIHLIQHVVERFVHAGDAVGPRHDLIVRLDVAKRQFQRLHFRDDVELHGGLAAEHAKAVLEVEREAVRVALIAEHVVNLLSEWALHEVVAQVCALFHYGTNNEADVLFVGMILEQLDGRLTSAVHGRHEHYLEVDLVHVFATAGALSKAELVERRVDELASDAELAPFLALKTVVLDYLLMGNVEWSGSVSDEEHASLLEVCAVGRFDIGLNLLHKYLGRESTALTVVHLRLLFLLTFHTFNFV